MVFFLLLLYCVKTTPKSIIMRKARVLFVSQEITPYLDETHIGKISRRLPQAIQERGKEIRTFMPKYGNINIWFGIIPILIRDVTIRYISRNVITC